MTKSSPFYLSVFISIIFIVMQFTTTVSAAKRAKPVIAIKQAKMGEGLGKYAKKHLNLTTILDEME